MADQHGPCDEVGRSRRSCPQKPCGFAAALGRRYGVAHNSTGPTSVSIDFKIQKGSWGFAGESIGATEHAWLGNARRLGNPSVVQFYSGPLMHFLSGVDTRYLHQLDSADRQEPSLASTTKST